MTHLRCEGPTCEVLTERARAEHWDDLLDGRCLCAEACARLDRRRVVRLVGSDHLRLTAENSGPPPTPPTGTVVSRVPPEADSPFPGLDYCSHRI